MSEPRVYNVLNLGAGVQSTTLLLMMCRGELPRPDVAIFADTQWEPREVYEHLAWLESVAAQAGIRVVRVTAGNLRADAIEFRQNRITLGAKDGGKRYASIPLFVRNADGTQGFIRRQCTSEYKIRPIEKYVRHVLLGLSKRQRVPAGVLVRHWMGITIDEAQRMRLAQERWRQHVYPFCNEPERYFDMPWRRDRCVAWLRENYPDRHVPRSACIGCPFHNNAEWRRIKENPVEWADAVDFDKQIRVADSAGQQKRKLLVGLPYVHREMRPLDEVDLRSIDDRENLWNIECEGMCGV